jgi:uncharacterized SAM-binding protein YcdF (DUF218 family)
MVWLAMVSLLAFAMPAVSETLLIALGAGLETTPPVDNQPQAIVVLGGEFARADGASPEAQVGLLTLERLRTGAKLQRRTGLPILVSGGTVQPHGPPMGTLMARSLVEDFHVPVRWIEIKSNDTLENAHNSALMLQADGIRSIYVVTQPWHMRRALTAFTHTGLTVTPAPTSLDAGAPLNFGDFLPRVSAWQSGFYAVHEWAGRVWYALH